MELTFRMYLPRDRQAVFDLWKDFVSPEKLPRRQKLFGWLVDRNPYLKGKSPYHVVLDGEKLVAHYGNMPMEFMVEGQQTDGSICHDIYVHRAYRGKQAAVSDRLVGALEEKSDHFILALWFARFNYGLHKRCDWLEIHNCYSMVRIRDLSSFLGKPTHIGKRVSCMLGNLALRLLDLRSVSHRRSRVEVQRIESFDERFDDFAQKVSSEFGVIAMRTSAYLNWKYVDRPYMKYEILAATDEGRVRGYVVYRVDRSDGENKGIILDILASRRTPEVYQALIMESVRRLSAVDVANVVCVNTCPTFERVLKRCGFLRARKPNPVMVANWEGRFSEDYARNIENWYITRGDGDGDFWTIDESVASENRK